MTKPWKRLIALCAVGAVLAGCTSKTETEEPAPASESHVVHEEHGSPEPIVIPSWEATSAAKAEEQARSFVSAYLKPGQSKSEWFAAIEPYLAPDAKEIYAEVDNKNIVPAEIKRVHPAKRKGSDALAEVQVDTSGKTYIVLFSRINNDPWLVESLTTKEK